MGESGISLFKRMVVHVKRTKDKYGIDLTKTDPETLPDAGNQRIEYTARIYKYDNGKWVYPGVAQYITFILKDVSQEKGVCLNYPMNGNTNPDLFFADDDERMQGFDFDDDHTSGEPCPTFITFDKENPEHSHHYLKATTKEAVTEATVIVRCEDFGAFGVLKAEASGCESIPPRYKNEDQSIGTGPNDVKFPKDEDGNNVADCAPQDDNGADPKSDNDSTPTGDGTPGDGLTNYEEYRGFIVWMGYYDQHIRTDITRKDVFINDVDGLGFGWFEKSELVLHELLGSDYYNGNSTNNDTGPDAGTQVINFNRGFATGGEQHGLRLVNENLVGAYGQAIGSGPGLPKVTNRVAIDVSAIVSSGHSIEYTIAHELGHGVNLWHHGPPNKFHDNHNEGKTEVAHGTTSGDADCIMRYYRFINYWCHPIEDGCDVHPIPANENPGTIFCTSKHGTGCNDVPNDFNNKAADDKPTRGACKTHIRVKDW